MSYLEDLIAHMNLLLNVMYGIVRELDINPRLNIYIYEYHQRMLYRLWLVSNSRVLFYHIAIVEF